jgi:hypothetical protein
VEKIGVRILTAMFLCSINSPAALHDPFPQGSLMGNLGTIISQNGPGSRAPLTSAGFMNDSLFAGVSASVCTYYDDMNNFQDRQFTSATGGGWLSFRRVRLKAAFSHFDALGAYREQSGYLSCAVALYRDFRVSLDLTGTRFFLVAPEENAVLLGQSGFSLFIPLKLVSFSTTVDHITLKSTRRNGGDPDIRIRLGIHTNQNTFGAQGVLITINPNYEHPVSVAIGQEFQLASFIALHGAVANNPLFFGLGVTVFIRTGSASAALVNHPVLGWSRGFSAEYGWNPSRFKKVPSN